MSLNPGAFVGRGDMPAVAMRPSGVGCGSNHGVRPGTAATMSKKRSATNNAIVDAM